MWTGEVERDIKEEGDTRERNRERDREEYKAKDEDR